MLDNSLCQIGFTKPEAKVYLELSKLGSQVVSVIAKRLGINRTTAYSILKSLEKKGVVSSFRSNGVKYFSANDPNCLIGYVDRKCQTYDYYKTELLALIPKFRDIRGEYSFSPPLVSYFEGAEGVKYVMYDALNAKNDYCVFGLKDFLIQYENIRVKNKNLKLRVIFSDAGDIREIDNMMEIRCVNSPNLIKMFENQVSVYNDRISIIHTEKGEEYGVIIESKEIANMQRAIFELAWAGCKV